MMKQMQQSVCALAVLAATTLPAMAASTVDVRVIGTITPTACTPTLSGGGTIDYGAINPNTLSATDYTVLEERQIDFSITCDAPAKVAIKSTNGRPNTVAGSTETAAGSAFPPAGVSIFGQTNLGVLGLGLDGTAKIGGYAVRLEQGTIVVDGSINANNLASTDNGTTWLGTASGAFNVPNAERLITWGNGTNTIPIAFTTLTGKLGAQAYLNKSSELDLTKPVALDGLTTIELVYL
ncbi:DUF1120 domain-containing protein [Serratia rubidaea]|uniref:DUF1120 domain-containing protein n=1 Tax=Serratia rubidaea TaxID=61652 RepID=UPI002DBD415A|nr:DUF1120 domain-containing protein [Serratia rubidaea]MEB7587824.1 DUF1120 domain-containing protein [Serratia rubidaea]